MFQSVFQYTFHTQQLEGVSLTLHGFGAFDKCVLFFFLCVSFHW